ncbi:hypothetical protein D9758_009278 [Tetrapyrgos nigripes]|uniref:Major facilitator superfamily (MFS) profile domain-containing protein n=1 Tax=Tetrapyrgos nigripes TaxID=182062 RepID=A0A8H5GHF6_9AGAR|nr:hypothetical protein D9758_009278 [Tetrapyrgos nigripes]
MRPEGLKCELEPAFLVLYCNVGMDVQTPLPKLQLAILLLIQATEPITATVIYPFIPEFIRKTGITGGDEKKTGYYAGVVESCFFISEALVCFYWGRASDLIGRRPVLLLGPLGLALSMFAFGLSKTFWPLVIFRCLQGTFNGNIGVSKTVMMEITDSTNRADCFTLMPIMWSVGRSISVLYYARVGTIDALPMIGGLLADPSKRWPKLAETIPLLKEYPYLLPCSAAGCLAFIAFLLGYLGLKETLSSIVNAKAIYQPAEAESLLSSSEHDFGGQTREFDDNPSKSDSTTPLIPSEVRGARYGTTNSDRADSGYNDELSPTLTKPTLPTYAEIFTPRLKAILVNNCFLTFTDMSYSVLIPLVYSTSIPIGGLGFPPHIIGLIMGIASFLNSFVQMFGLTKLLKKIGARRMYQIAYGSLILDFAGLWLLRVMVSREEKVTPVVWAVLVAQMSCACLINTAYNALNLLIVENAHPGALGVVNGSFQMMGCIFRGLAPLAASSLFSLSLTSKIAGGYLVYMLLMGVTVVGILCSLRLHK